MKKLISILILVALGILYSIGVMAQGPPNPPSDPNAGGNQTAPGGPGGAPIDGGLGILLVLGAGYAAKKVFNARTVKSE